MSHSEDGKLEIAYPTTLPAKNWRVRCCSQSRANLPWEPRSLERRPPLRAGSSGWDVAEAFQTSHPEVPVIYASENPANDHCRVAGSVFLSKPVAASELTATCRKLLARPISP
jgi:hypothetical protein